MIDQQDLIADKADTSPFTFRDPSVLGRFVALPGVRSSESVLANHQSKKILAAAFDCRIDELRLMQDSDMARKPDKIQDLECFLGVYDWLEFLPGAELDRIPTRSVAKDGSAITGGRKEATLMALFLNFGSVATRHKEQPARMKQWVAQRIERLVQQGALLRKEGVIRIEPRFLRQLKRIETQEDRQRVIENKALTAN